jgi:sterol desaturase/sphingolipid hydroxylase (fatty acid hydroxylase superfamily)
LAIATIEAEGGAGGFEALIRLSAFAGVLVAMSVWELAAPRRRLHVRKGPRWFSNLSLVALNRLALRLVLPMTAVALADIASRRGWGALNLVEWPTPVEFVLGFLVLDFVIYLQHVMFHAVPAFWRLHRVHHADLDFDVTTGVRFHTLEIILSMIIKLGAVLALGPSAWCVVAFEVALNATSMFNHANVRMPVRLDALLRLLVVTPDMHRVHHSVIRRETDSNFGFNFPWWDRLCGTYRAQPRDGHEQMQIGLLPYRDERTTSRLHRMLALPFGPAEAGGIVGEVEKDR